MNPNDDFEKTVREALGLRRQYIGGWLRTAWNAVFNRARIFLDQGRRAGGYPATSFSRQS
jgi:hypothetical protein